MTQPQPVFCLAPAFGVVPQRAWYDGSVVNGYFTDHDDVWKSLISDPPVGTKEGSCIRGVLFNEEALHPTQLNVEKIFGLVLDVDEFDGRPVYQKEEIAAKLFGCRHIVWTTYNSKPNAPRYRVILPLAQPIDRRRFRSLWELVNNDLGNVIGSKQFNADRLGYLPRLPNEQAREHYQWWIWQGPLLDPYVRYGELAETPDRIFLFEDETKVVDRSDWLSDDDALARARSYMRDAHVGVEPGARHHKLFEKSCQLWWDFYLPADKVALVLQEINARFSQPKTEFDVAREVEAGFAWTRGTDARPQNVPAGHRRRRPPQVTLAGLLALGTKLSRRQGQKDIGLALKKLSAREAFAEASEAVAVGRSLARTIAEEYPTADHAQVAKLFEASLALMQAQAGPHWPRDLTTELLGKVVQARQHELALQRKHKEEAKNAELSQRIAAAFGGARSTPYTTDEFAEFAQQHRCTYEELKHRLIVQCGPQYFFFLGGGYRGPYLAASAELKAIDALSPCAPLGVETHLVTKNDELRRKKVPDLVEQYGTVADKVVMDLARQSSRYEEATYTLMHAVCPIRPLTPERVPDIEQYLRLIGNENLLNWLAFLPRIDFPARILYLKSIANSGKNIMVRGMSRLWSTGGYTVGEDVLERYNEAITTCPLIFMDETLPQSFLGRKGTERLRAQVTSLERPYKAKYANHAVVKGALRFVMAANNLHMLETQDTLTDADVEAIRQRLLIVEIPQAAKDFINNLPLERTAKWVEEDLFAKHVLYLRDTRELKVGRIGPELIEEPSGEVDQTASDAVHAGLRYSGETDKIFGFLYDGVQEGTAQGCVYVGRERTSGAFSLLVNLEAVRQSWSIVLGTKGPERPSHKQLSSVFDNIPAGTTRAVVNKQKKRFRVVPLDPLTRWMKWSGGDVEAFGDRLGVLAQQSLVEFEQYKD